LSAGLREVASALLEHPGLALEDPVSVRVLSNAAVSEAMERGAPDLDSFLASTVMAAARRGVEHMRRAGERDRGTGHLPAGILVSAALIPEVLATASREAAQRHMAACAECTHQAQVVRQATAATTSSCELGSIAAPAPPPPRLQPTARRDRRVSEPPAPQDARLESELLIERMLESIKKSGPAEVRPRVRSLGRGVDPRRRTGARGEGPIQASRVALFALLGLVLVALALRPWGPGPPLAVLDDSIASFAEVELSPELRLSTNDERLAPGMQDLRAGDCELASSRFRLARKRAPSLARAWYWEGVASLCARRGPAAQQALQQAGDLDPELPELAWYQAQAALLAGDAARATALLGPLCQATGPRGAVACSQQARLASR